MYTQIAINFCSKVVEYSLAFSLSHSYYQTKNKEWRIQFQSLPKQDFVNMKEATVQFIKVLKNWSL